MLSAKRCVVGVMMGLLVCGCQQQKTAMLGSDAAKQFEAYGPEKLDVVGLSELKQGSGDGDTAKLKIFVRAMDAFGSALKTPCVFRVELYEHETRSSLAKGKGKRLEIWPDIDLADPCKNNGQWRDYLRAYEFNLDVRSKLTLGRVYIVDVTCLSPMEKRMSAQYNLSYQK